MASTTTRAKFDAAVNVIKSLPKNGSFQPSQEMMLEFYGFFKQATEGPCNLPKPSFWEVVKKAKWDAWSKLGNMPQEEAMLNYVEELKKIIETMPQTQMVADFMETLGTFYELVEDKTGKADDEEPNKEDTAMDISRELSFQLAAAEKTLSITCNGELDTPNETESSAIQHERESVDVTATQFDRHVEVRENREDSNPDLDERLDYESEVEEFCDSTDYITEVPASVELGEVMLSTPKQISTIMYNSNTEKRLSAPTVSSYLPSPVIPRLAHLRERPLSDSLIVNSPGDESLNTPFDETDLDSSPLDTSAPSQQNNSLHMDIHDWQDSSLPTESRSRRGLFSNTSKQNVSSAASLHGNPRPGDLTEQIAVTVMRLQQDMNSILSRLDNVERNVQRYQTMWWPFDHLSGRTLFFVLVWPILVNICLNKMFKRRR